jgi:hypothetical protein
MGGSLHRGNPLKCPSNLLGLLHKEPLGGGHATLFNGLLAAPSRPLNLRRSGDDFIPFSVISVDCLVQTEALTKGLSLGDRLFQGYPNWSTRSGGSIPPLHKLPQLPPSH